MFSFSETTCDSNRFISLNCYSRTFSSFTRLKTDRIDSTDRLRIESFLTVETVVSESDDDELLSSSKNWMNMLQILIFSSASRLFLNLTI